MSATDMVDQTLVCNIGDLTTAVTVSWTDKDDVELTNGQGGYTITQGTVDDSTKIQKSSLTITAATLQGLTTTSPVIWKCAAKSVQYSDSEQSTFKDLTVTFLTLGLSFRSVCIKIAKNRNILDKQCITFKI